MKQVNKFYLSSFLKNQTYFTPILILFLQINHLTFQQIFWVFTIGTIASFILEIPSGIFADMYGKKKAIIISWFILTASLIVFGFSNVFYMFIIAQVLWEIGNSFRSGSETAYVYDYLKQNNENNPMYKVVKVNQKVSARIGESIATAIGSLIVVYVNSLYGNNIGYNVVFFVAAVPAFFNFINVSTWVKIKEKDRGNRGLSESIVVTKKSFKEIVLTKRVLILTINIMIFTAVLAALNKFIQPYMIEAGVPIAAFGIIYSIALVLTAFIVKLSQKYEDKISQRKLINMLTLFAVVPAIILGFGFVALIGVILFFVIIIIENIRSPIAKDEFHSNISSETRATSGSILTLANSFGKIIILPIAGYYADVYSMSIAILIMGIILLINGLIFYVRKR